MAGQFDYLINVVFASQFAKQTEAQIKGVENAVDGMGKKFSTTESQVAALSGAMKKIGMNETQVKSIFSQFEQGVNPLKLSAQKLEAFNNALSKAGVPKSQIKQLNQELTKTGLITDKGTKQMGDFEKALRRAAIVAPVWMALRFAMQAVMNLIRDQVKFLIDLESAMARIKIVGKGTEEEFIALKNSLVALSFAYGTASSRALEAAVIFAQQGKSVSETIELTQQAMLASIVLGKDIKTVTEDMTAAMNSFGISSKDSISIIDKWIGVEKEFAVTSKDLADATKVTGATAKQVGVTIDALLGDVTAVIEVTRKSGSEAARGLQFIYARLLTSAKPVIESLTGIKFYLNETGKATNALTGTLRPATDILDELAKKWNSLTNEQQLQIASATGSKRQMNTLNALMINHNRGIDARIKSLTSAGEAERAFNIEQDTTKFKAEQLTAAWNNLTIAIADTGAFKIALDVMSQMIIGYTALINAEQGYRVVMAKEAVQQNLTNEKILQQAQNYKKLIEIRDKFLTAPRTDENTKRLESLNRVIQSFEAENVELKFAVASGDKEKVDAILNNIVEEASRQKIILQVKPEFMAKIGALEDELATIAPPTLFGKEISFIGLPKKAKELRKEINKLLVEYNDKVNELLQKEKDEKVIQEANSDNIAALTAEEEHRLGVERELSILNIKYNDDLEKRIEKEIQSVKNDNIQYNDKQRLLKLEELQNKLVEARLQSRKKEADQVKGLLFQLESADFEGRQKIKRQIELTTMQPGQVVQSYTSSSRDRAIILENIKDFDQAVQDTIAKLIASQRGIRYNPFAVTQAERTFKPSASVGQTPIVQSQVQVSSTVNVAPIQVKLDSEKISDRIMEDITPKLQQEITKQVTQVGTKLNKATREANEYGGEDQA